MSLTTRPASTGVATPISASATTTTRKTIRSARYGRAKRSTRRQVPARHLAAPAPRVAARHRPPGVAMHGRHRHRLPPRGERRRHGRCSRPTSVLARRARRGCAAGGTAPRARPPAARPGCARRARHAAAPWSRPRRRGRRRAGAATVRSTAASRSSAGDDRGGQADAQRLVGADAPAGQADLGGARVPDEVDEALGAAEVGDDAERRLGHHEARVVGEDADVGAERELESAADRVPLHGGDADQVGARATSRRRAATRAICAAGLGRRHRRSGRAMPGAPSTPSGVNMRAVQAGRERPALAAQHDDPDGAGQLGARPSTVRVQVCGVWAFSCSGRSRVMVATCAGDGQR